MVERLPSKQDVASPNLVSRSQFSQKSSPIPVSYEAAGGRFFCIYRRKMMKNGASERLPPCSICVFLKYYFPFAERNAIHDTIRF